MAEWCARQQRKRTHPNEQKIPPRRYAGEELPPEATWKTCFELIHMLRRRRDLERLKAFVRSNKAIADHELEHLESVYPDDLLEILVSVALRFCYARPDYPIDLILQHEGYADYTKPRIYVLREMRATWEWVRNLPRCPLTEEEVRDSDDWCREKPSAHKGASCYRSVGVVGRPGQQCCYVGGKLLTVGPSAGTPDRVAFARRKLADGTCDIDKSSAAAHFWEDEVIGMVTGLKDWESYLLRRPPSGSSEEAIVQRVATDGQ